MTYYRKMDITEYLMVLDSIKVYKLDEIIQWKILKIPFDISSSDIMNTFLTYMDELFLAKSNAISKPICLLKELYNLETYYQRINLYYSFSRSFHLYFEEQWVYNERIKVSEKINNLLKNIKG